MGPNAMSSVSQGLSAALLVARGCALALAMTLSSACASGSAERGETIYLSDCEAGARSGCTPGSDANDGRTEATPKRSLQAVRFNDLPRGSRVLLARGGAWSLTSPIELHNLQSSSQAPLLIDAYGPGDELPLIRSQAHVALQIGGRWGNVTDDGGYVIRNVVLQGAAIESDTRGVWLVQNVRDVTLDNVTVTGFRTGLQVQPGAPHGINGFTLRNSRVSGNRSFGMLFSGNGSVIENNVFEGNNFSGSAMNHAIYINGGGSRIVLRGNRFLGNSLVDGVCRGGNVTAHGRIDGLLIEGNTIAVPAAVNSCYGFSITAAYDGRDEFTGVVVRGNTIVDVGFTAIAANAAPGIVIEGNRVIYRQAGQQYSIWVPANRGAAANDARDQDAVVRDNIVCHLHASANSVPVSVTAPGSRLEGNRIIVGAAARSTPCNWKD